MHQATLDGIVRQGRGAISSPLAKGDYEMKSFLTKEQIKAIDMMVLKDLTKKANEGKATIAQIAQIGNIERKYGIAK